MQLAVGLGLGYRQLVGMLVKEKKQIPTRLPLMDQ